MKFTQLVILAVLLNGCASVEVNRQYPQQRIQGQRIALMPFQDTVRVVGFEAMRKIIGVDTFSRYFKSLIVSKLLLSLSDVDTSNTYSQADYSYLKQFERSVKSMQMDGYKYTILGRFPDENKCNTLDTTKYDILLFVFGTSIGANEYYSEKPIIYGDAPLHPKASSNILLWDVKRCQTILEGPVAVDFDQYFFLERKKEAIDKMVYILIDKIVNQATIKSK